jgi:hypothetical protein
LKKAHCVFSDNWIDVAPGRTRQLTLLKADAVGIESLDALRQNPVVRSLNDIMIDAAESTSTEAAVHGSEHPTTG